MLLAQVERVQRLVGTTILLEEMAAQVDLAPTILPEAALARVDMEEREQTEQVSLAHPVAEDQVVQGAAQEHLELETQAALVLRQEISAAAAAADLRRQAQMEQHQQEAMAEPVQPIRLRAHL